MAGFDPDEFLASKEEPAFDPDAFLNTPAAPEYDGPSPNLTPWQALGEDLVTQGKAALGGFTMGALPYAIAGVDSVVNDSKFDESLAEQKKIYNEAERKEPLAALGGSLLTPMPGAGASKGLAKVAKMAGTGAAAGGVESYLHNEKEGTGEKLFDASLPALIGGTLGGTVGALTNRAGAKADEALVPLKNEIVAGNEAAKAEYAKLGEKAEDLAAKHLLKGNETAIRVTQTAEQKLKERAYRNLLKKMEKDGDPEGKLKAALAKLEAEAAGVDASKQGLLGREAQRDYDAVRNFEDALRAKGDASPEALAQLEALKAKAGDVGERRMLDIAANPPEARADAKYAAMKKLIEDRKAALLAEKPKSADPLSLAADLAQKNVPDEAVEKLYAKYRGEARRLKLLKDAPPALSTEEARARALKRLQDPDFVARDLKNPALDRQLKAGAQTKPMPSDAELAKQLPKGEGLFSGAAKAALSPVRGPARALLGLAAESPKMSQGGYATRKYLEKAADTTQFGGKAGPGIANVTPASGHLADIVKKLLARDEEKGRD